MDPNSPFRIAVLIIVTTGFAVSDNERPPIFKSIPTIFKTREHDVVLMPCYVENLGNSEIKWLKDDELIAENGQSYRDNVVLRKDNSLEVSNVSSRDSGQYTCQVVRPDPWGPISQHHGIQVQFPPSVKLVPNRRELEVELHHEVIVRCEVDGVPKPFVRWLFQGEETSYDNNLHFFASDDSFSGEYVCIATNGVGNSATGHIDIKVVYPPAVKAEKILLHSAPRVQSVLTCEITGSPQPEVIWYFAGRPIPDDGFFLQIKQGTKYNLVIKSTKESHFGHYKCVASNKLGTVSQTLELSGLPNTPFFKKTHQDVYPDKAVLTWEVDSYSPIVQHKLFFRKYNISSKADNWTEVFVPAEFTGGPIHTQMYNLNGLERSSVYEAAVIAKNKFGWSSYSNIYLFATEGFDMSVLSTTEPEENVNTVNDLYSDYVTKSDENNHGSTRSLLVFVWYLLILIFLV
ncbi:neuroglian-like isoform X1 [Cimex lectularius]|uniref:Uncharacterized protein n=1 Tax=Cimex lectularius TaxID=79782 RepID=A0A8I6RRC8_CIMLE|nr:neuroglian-like isoform X1 [Cimex lectularius]